MGDDDCKALRDQLVDRLSNAGRLCTEQVADAFRTVPRHLFLPGVEPGKSYADEAIPTKWQPDGRAISSSSQPAVMAVMLEQLCVEAGQRVLEIGAGTGYNAALLSHLVGEAGAVTTVAEDLAPAWIDQLATGGRLVLPLSLRGAQRSVAFERAEDHLTSVSIVDCGFMPLRGALAGPDSVRRLGAEPWVHLRFDADREIDTGALYAALHQPWDAVSTGVGVTPDDVMGGLGLWLALHEPDIGQLSALGAAVGRGLVPTLVAFPGVALTTVLIGKGALAAFVRPDPSGAPADRFDLRVQPFGPEADELSRRLAEHVHTWEARGRPSTAELRIEAYRRTGADHDETRIVIDTRHARLLLDWSTPQRDRSPTYTSQSIEA